LRAVDVKVNEWFLVLWAKVGIFSLAASNISNNYSSMGLPSAAPVLVPARKQRLMHTHMSKK
jgi:hypothetical protein